MRSLPAVALVVLALIGCGGGDETKGTASSGQGPASSASAATSGPGGGAASSSGQGGGTTGTGGAAASSTTGQGGAVDPCAACPQSCCGGACADLQTDGAHCGACGHDCEGGACKAAVCQPVLVSPGRLVGIDATDIYVQDAQIEKLPKGGGALTAIGTLPVSIGATYWLSADAVYAASGGNSGKINKLSLGGGAAVDLATNENNPTHVIEVGGTVYWGTTGGAIRKVASGGGLVTSFLTGQSIPFDFASDGTNLYFTDTLAEKLKRVPLLGGAAITISNVPSVSRLVLDGTTLHVAAFDGVWSAQASGFSAMLEASSNNAVVGALDAEAGLFFGAGNDLRQGMNPYFAGVGVVNEVFLDAERIYFSVDQQGVFKAVR